MGSPDDVPVVFVGIHRCSLCLCVYVCMCLPACMCMPVCMCLYLCLSVCLDVGVADIVLPHSSNGTPQAQVQSQSMLDPLSWYVQLWPSAYHAQATVQQTCICIILQYQPPQPQPSQVLLRPYPADVTCHRPCITAAGLMHKSVSHWTTWQQSWDPNNGYTHSLAHTERSGRANTIQDRAGQGNTFNAIHKYIHTIHTYIHT